MGFPENNWGKAEDQIQSSVCSSLKQSFLLFLLSYLGTSLCKRSIVSLGTVFTTHGDCTGMLKLQLVRDLT